MVTLSPTSTANTPTELADADSGQLAVTGEAWLDEDLVLDFSGTSPFTAGSYTLMSCDSRTGTFDSVTDYVAVKVNFGNSLSKGETADQASVPEPGTAALLALGALLLLVARVARSRVRR